MPDTIEQVEKPLSLNEIVSQTVEKTNPDGTVKEEEKKEPVEKKEEKKIETSTDDLSPEEIELAKGMMRALKDPTQAPAVIDYFAKQGGYTKAEVKELKETLTEGTKEEKKEAQDEIVALFTDQFGEEFAAKLAPAIKKAIAKGVESETKTIKESFQQTELSRLEAESSKVLDSIATKFYGDGKDIPQDVASEMSKLMDIYPITKSQTQNDWLSDIHALAAAKKGGSLKPVEKVRSDDNRVERSKNDPTAKFSQRSPSPKDETQFEAQVAHIKDPLSRAIALGNLQLQNQNKKD